MLLQFSLVLQSLLNATHRGEIASILKLQYPDDHLFSKNLMGPPWSLPLPFDIDRWNANNCKPNSGW